MAREVIAILVAVSAFLLVASFFRSIFPEIGALSHLIIWGAGLTAASTAYYSIIREKAEKEQKKGLSTEEISQQLKEKREKNNHPSKTTYSKIKSLPKG